MLKRAREDVECALEIWGEILPKFFDSRLEYIYAKGSATKSWDSHVDYVPIVSDVDIHVKTVDDDELFGHNKDAFDLGMKLSLHCEDEFLRRKPDHLHVPRMQVTEIHFLTNLAHYTPPRPQDIRILYGTPNQKELPTPETVRDGDLDRIFEDEEYLNDLPRAAFDRTGLDFWSIVRTMGWRVSPAPVRILTQKHPDPLEVWSWNRTTIHRELLSKGYDRIATYYYGFYESGWNLYLSEFKGLKEFRAIVNNGYNLLNECLKEAHKISPG